MEYPVIVEQKNSIWRAIIPALAGLSVEGASRNEAVHNAQQAAKAYLSKVQVTAIEVDLPISKSIFLKALARVAL